MDAQWSGETYLGCREGEREMWRERRGGLRTAGGQFDPRRGFRARARARGRGDGMLDARGDVEQAAVHHDDARPPGRLRDLDERALHLQLELHEARLEVEDLRAATRARGRRPRAAVDEQRRHGGAAVHVEAARLQTEREEARERESARERARASASSPERSAPRARASRERARRRALTARAMRRIVEERPPHGPPVRTMR